MTTDGGRPDWEAEADRLAAVALSTGQPTAWFDQLYAAAKAGRVAAPWARTAPNPLLVEWLGYRGGANRSAAVVGCGFGADAEFLQRRGFDVVGFDVSPTAIELTRARHPETRVHYQTADLFDLPPYWPRSFDLVVEIFTVQALPVPVREQAVAAIANLVAPFGTLFVVQMVRDGPADAAFAAAGPPWPLSRDEVELFGEHLQEVRIEDRAVGPGPRDRRWMAEFRRS